MLIKVLLGHHAPSLFSPSLLILTVQSSPSGPSSPTSPSVSSPTCHTAGSEIQERVSLSADNLHTNITMMKNVRGFGHSGSDTYALANRTAGVGLIRAVFSRQLTAGLQCGVVDGLKDLDVEQLGFVTLEREAHQDEGISQSLHADTNGPVAFV